MQKSFKRTLSLLLAVVMICTLMAVAPLTVSAANVDQGAIALNESKTATISGDGDVAIWSFTPAQDVTVKFYSASPDKDTYGHLYDSQMDELATNDDDGEGSNFLIKYFLYGGETYYFGARFYSNGTGDISVTLEQAPTWEYDNDTITAYNGNDTEVVIPGEIDGQAVTSINSNLFSGKSDITKVTISEGITQIGSNAFSGCSSLTTVKLPNSLTTINSDAFHYDDSLLTLEIPENVASISSYALYPSNCRVMTFLTKATSGSVATDGIKTYGTTVYQCYEGSFIDNYLKSNGVTDRIRYIDDNTAHTVTYNNYMSPASDITNMPAQGTANPSCTISSTVPTSSDRVFMGWDTSTSSNKVVYYPGETYTFAEDTTLYGVWACKLDFYVNEDLIYTKLVMDFSDISTYDIPVPARINGKYFDGYYHGATKCFSFGYGLSYEPDSLSASYIYDGSIRLSAEWVDAAQPAGTTVSLDDVIRLNLYVDKKGSSDSLGFSVINNDNDTNLEGDDRMQGLSEDAGDYTVTDEDSYYKVSIKVYAKEMADRFTISCYNNTRQQLAFDYTTSAKHYLETLAQNADTIDPDHADTLRNLCYATLNYGAAAQKQFTHYGDFGYGNGSYNVPLANENVPAAYNAVGVPANLAYDEGSQSDFSEFGLSYYASSLGLYDYTSYAVCFERTETKDIRVCDSNGNTLDYAEVGKAYHSDTDEENYMIAYTISDIPAKDILNDFTLKFYEWVYGYYDENNEWVDGYYELKKTCTFSPKTYIAKVLNKAGVNPDYTTEKTNDDQDYNSKERQSMQNLAETVNAIYDYSMRAKAYFD